MAQPQQVQLGIAGASVIIWLSLMTTMVVLVVVERGEVGIAGTIAAVLGVALGAILVSSAGATYIHRRFGLLSQRPADTDYGAVFQQYVNKFSLFVGPVSGSYGIVKLVELFTK